MTAKLSKQIRRLESILHSAARPVAVFRFGPINYLREHTTDERHIVDSESQSTALSNVERCEFEERAGPCPESEDLSFTVYLDLGQGTELPPPEVSPITALPSEANSVEDLKETML